MSASMIQPEAGRVYTITGLPPKPRKWKGSQLSLSDRFGVFVTNSFTPNSHQAQNLLCMINSTTGRYWSVAFIWMDTLKNFIHRFISCNHLVQLIHCTIGMYCSVAFIWILTLKDFINRLKSQNHLLQHNKQHLRKVVLRSFHWNVHTLGFFSSPKS